MANKIQSGKSSVSQNQTWKWASAAVILLLVIIWQSQVSRVFTFVGGDDGSVLVLLNSSKKINYSVEYTGRKSINITGINLKLIAGTDLVVHTDVSSIEIMVGDKQIQLNANGTVPSDVEFSVESGDIIQIDITLNGRTLGYNRLEELIINYSQNSQASPPFGIPLVDTYFHVE